MHGLHHFGLGAAFSEGVGRVGVDAVGALHSVRHGHGDERFFAGGEGAFGKHGPGVDEEFIGKLLLLPASRCYPRYPARQLARLPRPLRLVLEVLVLDYLGYSWHLRRHSPLLWRLHRVHYNNLGMASTMAWRFHFGEMLANIPYRAGLPALLGTRLATVLAYEAVFEAGTAFHHSNWQWPLAVECRLVRLGVAPCAHGIHHAMVHREPQSNFGVGLTLRDRLLRLNVPQQALTIGVPAYPDPAQTRPLGELVP